MPRLHRGGSIPGSPPPSPRHCATCCCSQMAPAKTPVHTPECVDTRAAFEAAWARHHGQKHMVEGQYHRANQAAMRCPACRADAVQREP